MRKLFSISKFKHIQYFPLEIQENKDNVYFLGEGKNTQVFWIQGESKVWLRSNNNMLESIANYTNFDISIHIPRIEKTRYFVDSMVKWYRSELLYPLTSTHKEYKNIRKMINYISSSFNYAEYNKILNCIEKKYPIWYDSFYELICRAQDWHWQFSIDLCMKNVMVRPNHNTIVWNDMINFYTDHVMIGTIPFSEIESY